MGLPLQIAGGLLGPVGGHVSAAAASAHTPRRLVITDLAPHFFFIAFRCVARARASTFGSVGCTGCKRRTDSMSSGRNGDCKYRACGLARFMFAIVFRTL
jgi:hypothetical protein